VAVADRLKARGWSVAVLNARFLKPLDRETVLAQAKGKSLVVTLEESAATGGFGAAVLEALSDAGMSQPEFRAIPVKQIGIPPDRFVDHGSVDDLRRVTRLDEQGIEEQIREAIELAGITPASPDRLEVRSA
jgi:1-deoxy-D-xylulose-5-phosphate synthase